MVTAITSFDPVLVARNLEFLQKNPWFDERPASITEFLGPGYLEIIEGVRPGILKELIELFGEESNPDRIALVEEAMFTGAIGIGKTTIASVVIPYMVHWVLCLNDPQKYYKLLPGSRIALMQMSTSDSQAKGVVFGDIKARIERSPWFIERYPYDPAFTNQLRFAKDIWVLPGNSAETTFEGYNILGGIVDEADSHKVTEEKDYAQQGFDTIDGRVRSRFKDKGFILVIGQMKKANGFAAKKYAEMKKNPKAHTMRMALWESLGWEEYLKPDGTRDSFYYDSRRKAIIPEGVVDFIKGAANVIEIPKVYEQTFKNNPEKALRDLAGIPPATNDPFISLVDRVDEAVDKWQLRNNQIGSPVDTNPTRPQFADWFKCQDSLKRAIHIDMAVSGKGDALGMAMGHVREVVERDGELKPYIVFDMLLRIKAMPGTEIIISEVRQLVYFLADELHFKIKAITMDGFQSTDSLQQFRKRRFFADYLSVDRQKLPYEDLREAVNERRIEFPPYFTYLNKGDLETVQIAVKELTELQDDGKKIDHQEDGSKDVADAMAAVCCTLMGDRSYRRGVTSIDLVQDKPDPSEKPGFFGSGPAHPTLGDLGMKAPIPPQQPQQGSMTTFPIPGFPYNT